MGEGLRYETSLAEGDAPPAREFDGNPHDRSYPHPKSDAELRLFAG